MKQRNWILKMAWRDSRKNRGRLALFVASMVLGIAALVAIQSLGISLKEQIDAEAKGLLGADLEISSRFPIPEVVSNCIDSLAMPASEQVSFASMVLFADGSTRLVNVRALSPGYPYYGQIETDPAGMRAAIDSTGGALLHSTLGSQFRVAPGDSVQLGYRLFPVSAMVKQVPGQAGLGASVAPPVFIPLHTLESTGLVQLGSRLTYKLFVKFRNDADFEAYEALLEPILTRLDLSYDDVEERQQEMGDAYADLTSFLNLTAFIALLLGAIGVGSSVNVYMKEKISDVATLRCLGTRARTAMYIYLVQVLAIGLLSALLGAILGTLLQQTLPPLLSSLIPFELENSLQPSAWLQGVGIGALTSLLLGAIPLLRVARIPPLAVWRPQPEKIRSRAGERWIYAALLLSVCAFAWWQLGQPLYAAMFTAGLLLAFGILTGVGWLLMQTLRRMKFAGAPFVYRQALSNLYRPNNQTLVLTVTIGLGAMLLTILLLTQQTVLNKITFDSSRANQPNMLLFDIQEDQIDSVQQLTREMDMPVLGQVPIVTMRMHSVKGIPVEEMRRDTASGVPKWLLRREYRVTYRDSLTASEVLTEGDWHGDIDFAADRVPISVEEGMAGDLELALGDELAFNVQGAMIHTYVSSFRKIDWQRVQTNFLVLFPEGVLEPAPKFYVLLSRFETVEESASYQRQVVQRFPNISIIDLNLIVSTLSEILEKVSMVIRFMALFSMVTGAIVLLGSIATTRFQRMRESVLLRTIGARKKQIFRIQALEFTLLGLLAGTVGVSLGMSFSAILAWQAFDTVTVIEPGPALLILTGVCAATVIIGLMNIREVVRQPPLVILRKEG